MVGKDPEDRSLLYLPRDLLHVSLLLHLYNSSPSHSYN